MQREPALGQGWPSTAHPDQRGPKKWIDETADADAKQRYETVFKALASQGWREKITSLKKGIRIDGPEASPYYIFSFDAEAQEIATDWFITLEKKIAAEKVPAFRSHIAKYRGLMPRLALNYFLIEASAGSIDHPSIPPTAVRYAIRWCEHLESHARKLWASALDPSLEAMRSLAKRIEDGQLTQITSLRDIQQSNWAGLKTVSNVESAVRRLNALGWTRMIIDNSSGGRPSPKVEINPYLLDLLGVRDF